MTTHLRRPVVSLSKQIPLQLLLYNTTTSLMPPVTTFFDLQMKKSLSKATTTKLYPAKKWKRNIRIYLYLCNKAIIIKQLYLYYCYFIMQSLFSLFNANKNWTIYNI